MGLGGKTFGTTGFEASWFARLVAARKPKMRAVGACRLKLTVICWDILKNRQPFDPLWASRTAS
jgi:hypothetical protein